MGLRPAAVSPAVGWRRSGGGQARRSRYSRAPVPGTGPVTELDEGFSEPGAAARRWAGAAGVLSKTEMSWLPAVRGDGRPHVTPLPGIWLDGTLRFCAGPQEQKAKNRQADPGCVLAAGASQFRAGRGVAAEGPAVLVTGPARLQRLAARWKPELGWDFTVAGGGVRDPAGRRGLGFGVTSAKVLAFGKSPCSQTRYRFTG